MFNVRCSRCRETILNLQHSTSSADADRVPSILSPVILRLSKDFVAGDSQDVRSTATVGIDALHTETPLDRQKRTERRRRLDRSAEARKISRSRAECRVMNLGGICE